MSNYLRKHKRADYTTIDNQLLCDKRLSFRARGIAAYLLTKPDDWQINMREIEQAGTEGREAIRAAMKELATMGYIMRDKEQALDGTIITITLIAEYPAYINIGTPETRFVGYGDNQPNRPTRKPSVGANGRIVITDHTNNTTYCAPPAGGKFHVCDEQGELIHVESEPSPMRDIDHPAVVAYREIRGKNPNRGQMRIIVEKNPNIENWKRAIREWIGRDYKPTNVAGMLEWAENPHLMSRKPTAKRVNDEIGNISWSEVFARQAEMDREREEKRSA